MITRRDFVKSAGGAAGGLLFAGVAAPGAFATAAVTPTLRAREVSVQLLPDEYPQTRLWRYSDGLAGETLRLGQGQRLARRLVNDLAQPTSVHWHGIRIDNRMDGVAGLTQAPVAPGESFDYDFVVPDAGTYWYHAHTRSFEQVARGLYGALIVDEAEPPKVDRDEVLLLDDWRLDPEDGQLTAPFGAMHDNSHAGRLGNYVTANGRSDLGLDLNRGDRLRLRLVNVANARVFALGLQGLTGWIVAHDGMPLATPKPIPRQLILAPAQRIDLILDVATAEDGDSAWLVQFEGDQGYALTEFRLNGTVPATGRPAPPPLPPNPRMAVTGLDGARRVRLNMEGGAMGGMGAATLDGQRKSGRELAEAGMFWAFNGTAGMTGMPLAEVARGETVRIKIVNDTVFPHAMHLHGMHFREVLASGAVGPMRDTLLVLRGESREIAFVADNPGDWLLHCHMLAHAAAGMTTWVKVV